MVLQFPAAQQMAQQLVCFPVPSDAARSASAAAADAELLPAATAAAAADDGPAGSNAAEDGGSSSSAKAANPSAAPPGPAKRGPDSTATGASGKSLAERSQAAGFGVLASAFQVLYAFVRGSWLFRATEPR